MDNLEFFSFIHPVLIYLIIFFGLALEGEITLLASGFLLYFGLLDYLVLVPVVFLGSWLGDMIWFWGGEKWGSDYFNKHQRWLFLTKSHFERLAKHFTENHGTKTIFLSKFSYGINHAIIVVAGASRMNFKKFIKVDAWATIIWALIILQLVQILGRSFQYIKHLTKDLGVAIGLVVILFIIIEIILSKKASKSL